MLCNENMYHLCYHIYIYLGFIMPVIIRMDVSLQIQIYFCSVQEQCIEIYVLVYSFPFSIKPLLFSFSALISLLYSLFLNTAWWYRWRWLCCLLWDEWHRDKARFWEELLGNILLNFQNSKIDAYFGFLESSSYMWDPSA